MIDPVGIVVVVGWFVSLSVAIFVVPKLASKRVCREFGLTKVQNSRGEDIYAPVDPDGEPIKVPVARVVDGKVKVTEEYAPLAFCLPTIAAMQIKASFQGKVGQLKQQMENSLLEGLPIEQAANIQALQLLAKGKVGPAFLAFTIPKIAAMMNASGNAGKQAQTQGFAPGVLER